MLRLKSLISFRKRTLLGESKDKDGLENYYNLTYCDNIMSDDRKISGPNDGTATLTKAKPKTKKPSMYRVLLLNDDYTPMEFVVLVLTNIFSMAEEKATEVMLHVHRKGVGVCGVYSYEIAETKVAQVMDFARRNEHPLQCTMEKD